MFVANRLNEIFENSNGSEWFFVPSNKNPADNATRGLHADTAFTSNSWLTGPDFLADRNQWPKAPSHQSHQTCSGTGDSKEMTPACFPERLFINHQAFSQWTRLLNVVVTIIRFVAKLKKQNINYTEAIRTATTKLFSIS